MASSSSSITSTRGLCTSSFHSAPHQTLLPLYNSINFSRSKSSISINNNGCGGYGQKKIGSLKIRAMSETFGSRLEETIKKTITQNPVVVYSKSWCSYSSEVKSLFKRLGVEPHVIELDELGPQGPQLQKLLERLTGQHTVPNVFIGAKHIGGCSDTVKLHRKGELEPLLTEAGAKNPKN